jgi:hypothetical protein
MAASHARGVAIEPVDEPRLLALFAAPDLQHVVDVAGNTGAALHRQPGWLVEDEDLVVLVQQHLAQHLRVVLVADRAAGQLALSLAVGIERRNAHHLPGLDARIGLGAAAIDADLAGTQQFLQMTEAEARVVRLEPAVEPHARLAGFHRDLLNAGHVPSFAPKVPYPHYDMALASQRPRNRATIAPRTLTST